MNPKTKRQSRMVRHRGKWILLKCDSPELRTSYAEHCAKRGTNMTADLNRHIRRMVRKEP